MVRIGAHMSIAGGYHKALLKGDELGCETIQIFMKSPGNWNVPALLDDEIQCWKKVRDGVDISPVIAHDCYLVNLASPNRALRKKSIKTLSLELERAGMLDVGLFVIHPGAHTGSGEEEGLKRIADALDRLLSESGSSGITVLLETTAGQGTSLGYRFEHLAVIMATIISRDRLGVWLDHFHLFAAGYDLRCAK